MLTVHSLTHLINATSVIFPNINRQVIHHKSYFASVLFSVGTLGENTVKKSYMRDTVMEMGHLHIDSVVWPAG